MSTAPDDSTTNKPDSSSRHRTLLERRNACDRRKEWVFYAALAHAIKDCHLDEFGHDQWLLPLVLSTILAYQFIHRWEIVLLVFIVFYVANIALYMVLRGFTRNTTATITARHQLGSELLTDPMLFVFTLFVAWYLVDRTVLGFGVHGPTEWWRSTLVVGVSLLAGHAHLYWQTLVLLLGTIWGTHLFTLAESESAKRIDHSFRISASSTLFVLFFFLGFLQPIRGHFMQNALWTLLLALFFASAIQFISIQ